MTTPSSAPRYSERIPSTLVKRMNDLHQLWKLTGEDITEYSEDENHYYDPIGLILFKDVACWNYWCTPTNTLTFATTGGDGVHYGILRIEGKNWISLQW